MTIIYFNLIYNHDRIIERNDAHVDLQLGWEGSKQGGGRVTNMFQFIFRLCPQGEKESGVIPAARPYQYPGKGDNHVTAS